MDISVLNLPNKISVYSQFQLVNLKRMN